MDVNGQTVMVEENDENYEPSEEEVLKYCREVLKLDMNTEKDLIYIGRAALKAPLPRGWKGVMDQTTGKMYYFNFTTGKSIWEDPCDAQYRSIVEEERKKRRMHSGTTGVKKGGSKKTGKAEKPTPSDSQISSGALGPLSSGAKLGPLGPIRGLPPLKISADALSSQPPLGPLKLAPAHTVVTSTSAPIKIILSTLSQSQKIAPAHTVATSTHAQTMSTSSIPSQTPTTSITASTAPLQARLGLSSGGGSGSRDLLGMSKLGESLKISNTFIEEEEEEEEDDDYGDTAFQSKVLGNNNLLDAKYLRLDNQIDEDLHSSEEENVTEDNVSEELKRMMASDEEEVDADVVIGERPSAPLGARPPLTGLSPTEGPLSPILSPPIPSSLSPFPGLRYYQTPAPTDDTTPTAPPVTSVRDTILTTNTISNARGPMFRYGSSITAPHGVKQVTTPPIISSSITGVSTINSANEIKAGSTPVTGTASLLSNTSLTRTTALATTTTTTSTTAAIIDTINKPLTIATLKSTVTAKSTSGRISETEDDEMRRVGEENKKQLDELRREHEIAMKQLKDQLSAELKKEEEEVKKNHETEIQKEREDRRQEIEKLHREGKEELEKVRKTVEEQRAKEEKEMRDRKLQAINELRKTLKDEEEEEEARLVEEKENSIRQLKQKIAAEREREEVKLREEAAKSRHELLSKIATEKQVEETRLRSISNKEIADFKKEEEKRAENEKEDVKRELQRQLQVFREEQEEKHNKERAEIEENFRGQLEAFKHEEQDKVRQELERKQLADEERERTVQQQQEDLVTLKQELAAELEQKRLELQQQNQTALDTIKQELEVDLDTAKSEHQIQIEQEKKKLRTEFETASATLQREHEMSVEQLKRDLASLEDQHRTQLQIQSEKLKGIQAEYDQKCTELQQLQQEVEQELVKAELDKQRLKEEQERLQLNHYRTERSKRRLRDAPREDEEFSEGSNSGDSMHIKDLEPPNASSSPAPVSPEERSRANLESVHRMLEDNQRTLLRILGEEEHSKVVARERRREKSERREERRRREKSSTIRSPPSAKPPRTKKDDTPSFPTSSVKSKLKEEVKALGELEQKLRSSRQLLLSREQDLHNLHSHLSEDIMSDETRIREGYSPRPSSPAPTQSGYHDGRYSRQADTDSNERAPVDARPPLGQSTIVASSEERERRRRNKKRERRERSQSRENYDSKGDTYTTKTAGQRLREQETRVSPSEGFHFMSSASEEEREVSGSSFSRSPSPSHHASTENDDQMESQREMVRSLHTINRQLHELTSQISQGSPRRLVLPPRHHVAPVHYYPTSPPHPSSSSSPSIRWANPVPMPPSSYVQTKQMRVSTKHKRHSQPSQSLHYPHRTRSSDSHVTRSPTHIHPGYVSEGGVDWVGQFHTQFPSKAPLSVLRPISAPVSGGFNVPHAQLVMDSDKNIHLVHM